VLLHLLLCYVVGGVEPEIRIRSTLKVKMVHSINSISKNYDQIKAESGNKKLRKTGKV
jgi:hypothetical protein